MALKVIRIDCSSNSHFVQAFFNLYMRTHLRLAPLA